MIDDQLETIVPDDDDETLNEADCAAIAEAQEWLKHNEPIPHEQVLSEFGLTMADWEAMAREPQDAPRHDS
jgi:O-succinylbenzoate synthase